MRRLRLRRDFSALGGAILLLVLVVLLAARVGDAGAADAEALEGRLTAARDDASSLAAQMRSTHERLVTAEAEATEAEAHEERLSGLLAEGEERAAELSEQLQRTRHRLAVEKARLGRSRHILARRLVAIYKSGTPDTASLVLGSGDFDDLITRTDYLHEISESDSALARRVAEVRASVQHAAERVAALRRQAIAYDERLAAARERIGAVREAAEAAAGRLHTVEAEREASLAELKADIAKWVKQVQAVRAAEARAASAAEAEEEVGRWLGGPYSIPTYIVMCESGGDYGAVNPSSGAGGAYQILPSTWELYGGQGEPQNGSKSEQDQIAAEIWADSGSSAWVCG